MSFNLKKIICTFVVMLFVSQSVFAQQENQNVSRGGPKKQISKIFLFGLGGAVFGLSTLSFYGRPQDHIQNIAGGFALGIIIGTIYVTYHTASKPKEYLTELQSPQYMNVTSRQNLDYKNHNPNLFTYDFSF